MVACAPQLVGQFVYHNNVPTNIFRVLFNFSALAKWMVSRDLVLAHHFARNFWWHHVMLLPSHMPAVSVLCLSTNDEYVPVDFVEKLLDQKVVMPRGKKTVMHVEQIEGSHGTFLLRPQIQSRVLATLKESIDICA
jgi:hypothetical protein